MFLIVKKDQRHILQMLFKWILEFFLARVKTVSLATVGSLVNLLTGHLKNHRGPSQWSRAKKVYFAFVFCHHRHINLIISSSCVFVKNLSQRQYRSTGGTWRQGVQRDDGNPRGNWRQGEWKDVQSTRGVMFKSNLRLRHAKSLCF